jgi:hypothetical protein
MILKTLSVGKCKEGSALNQLRIAAGSMPSARMCQLAKMPSGNLIGSCATSDWRVRGLSWQDHKEKKAFELERAHRCRACRMCTGCRPVRYGLPCFIRSNIANSNIVCHLSHCPNPYGFRDGERNDRVPKSRISGARKEFGLCSTRRPHGV